MSKRDELIEKYTAQMTEKLGMKPDVDLLTKVTIGCGPSIYNRDASTVAGSDPAELETVKKGFMTKKLGLTDEAKMDAGLEEVMATYGAKCRTKYRAVVYYMLTKHFGKESIYK